MNFTIDRTLFQDSLRKITAISSSKSELTKYLSLNIKKTFLTLSATDQDIISYVKIKTDDQEGSSCLVEAKALYNLIINLSKTTDKVTIKLDKKTLIVKADSNEYKFKTFNIEFPKFDIHSYVWSFSVEGEKFLHLIKNSGWAHASKEEERTYLQGVLFEVDGKLFVSSTDARKFSCSSTDVNIDTKFKFIILSKLSKIISLELTKYKPKKKTDITNFPEVKFNIGKKYVDIIVSGVHYTSKILNYSYPDIRNKQFTSNYNIMLNKKSLLDSIKRLDPFTDTIKNMLSFFCDDSKVKLKSWDISDDTLHSTELIANGWSYKDFEIGFRASSFSDILKHVVGKEITVQFESPNKFFKILDTESTVNTFYIIPYSKF